MTYELSPAQIEEIDTKLPPQFAALKDNYPVAISNAAEYYDAPPFEEGYVPEVIEVYYGEEADGAGILAWNGRVSIDLNNYQPGASVLMKQIDGQWAYIQIGSIVLLNRAGGVILPPIAEESDFMLDLMPEAEK